MIPEKERAWVISVRNGLLVALVGFLASVSMFAGAARVEGDGNKVLSWFLSMCGLFAAALTFVVVRDTWPLWRTKRQKKEDRVREVLRS